RRRYVPYARVPGVDLDVHDPPGNQRWSDTPEREALQGVRGDTVWRLTSANADGDQHDGGQDEQRPAVHLTTPTKIWMASRGEGRHCRTAFSPPKRHHSR